MPQALVVVRQRVSGTKDNFTQWPVKQTRGVTSWQPIDQAFINGLLGPRILAGNYDWHSPLQTTQPTQLLSPIESILFFMGCMQSTAVEYTKLYISDGVTPGPETGAGYRLPLAIGGWSFERPGGVVHADTLATKTASLLLAKTPVALDLDPGKIWLRYCMKRNEVGFIGDDGMDFASEGVREDIGEWFEEMKALSALPRWFAGSAIPGFEGEFYIGQGQYVSVAEAELDPTRKGVLESVRNISNMTLVGLNPRQATAGKKRKMSATQLMSQLQMRGLPIDAEAILATEGRAKRKATARPEARSRVYDEAQEAQANRVAIGTIAKNPPRAPRYSDAPELAQVLPEASDSGE